jgi:cyanate permease
VGCITSLSFYQKFLVTTILPLACLVLAVLCVWLPLVILDKTDYADADERRQRRAVWRRRLVKLFLFVSHFSSACAFCYPLWLHADLNVVLDRPCS